MAAIQPPIAGGDESAALQLLQRRRKVFLAGLCTVALLFSLLGAPGIPAGSYPHEWIEYGGMLLIGVCILGRVWATLYIGGRKKTELVRHGPYSLCRNPLYLFSFLGAAGLGALFGSLIFSLVLLAGCWAVFHLVTIREERFLRSRFGQAYEEYCREVPRFLPRFAGWRDLGTVEASPRLVLVAMRDSSVFLAAVPVAEGIEYLHQAGLLPTLFQLV
ncbi:methyltransferase family protein [Lutibaculum baratangense]|uniref:Nickel-cobalt-cadmium resistance protein NCCN n=1 Tax=Lutibaculum baratangense AMV1 TaxID=631454 RepID=V4TJD3_9HYPH|nr:isoprenylcysteine carboxylmethyltransferase family protein [Lutibaculum baratangense]ESR26028.1 Nickel-cobalt-cadmium resistance protein NCCN [Lutibaculum baratangense AMV1]